MKVFKAAAHTPSPSPPQFLPIINATSSLFLYKILDKSCVTYLLNVWFAIRALICSVLISFAHIYLPRYLPLFPVPFSNKQKKSETLHNLLFLTKWLFQCYLISFFISMILRHEIYYCFLVGFFYSFVLYSFFSSYIV